MNKAGNKILRCRRNNGLTQTEVAEMLGISKAMLSQIENDKKNPGFKLAKKIDDLINSYDFLINTKFEEPETLFDSFQANDDNNNCDYDDERIDLQEISQLLDVLIKNKLIIKASDIRQDAFTNAILAALEADLHFRLNENNEMK